MEVRRQTDGPPLPHRHHFAHARKPIIQHHLSRLQFVDN